jgi:hypothetical protein
LNEFFAWCATYPEEVPFALRFFTGRIDAVTQSSDPGAPSTGHGPLEPALAVGETSKDQLRVILGDVSSYPA